MMELYVSPYPTRSTVSTHIDAVSRSFDRKGKHGTSSLSHIHFPFFPLANKCSFPINAAKMAFEKLLLW